MDNEKRRDPLAGLGSGEPVEDLGLTVTPSALARRNDQRRRPVRPSEKRRRGRRLGVTFSDAGIPDRLRALAERWELFAPDGQSPNASAVVEHLILPRLEEAERGEIGPPED